MTASMHLADLRAEDLIFGATDEETAIVVDDYPYGRLRTQIRYWIETRKGHGDRFVSQTLNPKTGRWNAPKRGTYSDVAVMYRDRSNGHIGHTGIGTWAKPEVLQHFLDITEGQLSEIQKMHVARIIGINKAFEGVTWKVTTKGTETEEDKAAHEAASAQIARRMRVETHCAFANLTAEEG